MYVYMYIYIYIYIHIHVCTHRTDSLAGFRAFEPSPTQHAYPHITLHYFYVYYSTLCLSMHVHTHYITLFLCILQYIMSIYACTCKNYTYTRAWVKGTCHDCNEACFALFLHPAKKRVCACTFLERHLHTDRQTDR
jgi:hypothetical protein